MHRSAFEALTRAVLLWHRRQLSDKMATKYRAKWRGIEMSNVQQRGVDRFYSLITQWWIQKQSALLHTWQKRAENEKVELLEFQNRLSGYVRPVPILDPLY